MSAVRAQARAALALSAALGAALAAPGAPELKLRLLNDQAPVLVLLSAPARQTPAFELQSRGSASEPWSSVQPLETSFCLNPCPANGGFPDELDCARPPRTRIALPAGGGLAITWSGLLVEEVVRRHASGKLRTCTQVQPAPPRTYRLSLCADPVLAQPARCAAVIFRWPPGGDPAPRPAILRWSSAVVALD